MDFRIDSIIPATASQLWDIFFDVKRVATLIPGCENVVEVEEFKEFSAVLKQKIGPFKLEVPTKIHIDSYELKRHVSLKAAGSDKFTGTTIDVGMDVSLEEQSQGDTVICKLGVGASMQVAGRLASLGYPIVRKRSEELFAEFERRLRAEIANPGSNQGPAPDGSSRVPVGPEKVKDSEEMRQSVPTARAAEMPTQAMSQHLPSHQQAQPGRNDFAPRPPRDGGVELVFMWPRIGINVAVAIGVAHGAVAFGQSPWWWLAAPLLAVAASLGRRGS